MKKIFIFLFTILITIGSFNVSNGSEEKYINKLKDESNCVFGKYTYYDVPLDRDVQYVIFEECIKNDIDPKIIFSIIKRESNYDAKIIGDNGDSFGLMQIQPKWNHSRMKKLNCLNLLDPCENVKVGIDLIAELMGKNNSIAWCLMAYNSGETCATWMVNNGLISDYTRDVIYNIEEM